MDKISITHGEHITDALKHAIQHKYPSLCWLREASTDSSIEDRVRQLENIICRTIDSYQSLDFYTSHKQKLKSQLNRTIAPRMSISESGFNEYTSVPVGYYTAG